MQKTKRDRTAYHFAYYRQTKTRFRYSKYEAKRRNLEWALSLKEYEELIHKKCFYCGETINETSVGLDRINNDIGYIKNNVIPCCKICNNARRDTFTMQEFKVMITALIEYRNERKSV